MNIEGTHEFDAPQELVWSMLLDPVVLAKVMPNCQALEKVGDNEYKGKMKIQVGPVQGVFQGKVTLSEINAPTSYRMQVQGKGPAGIVDGEGDVRLESVSGPNGSSKTVMHYAGEAKVSGKIASVGQRLMDTSARAITKQSLENLETQIEAIQNAKNAPPEPAEELPSTPAESTASSPTAESRAASPSTAAPPIPDTPSASSAQFAASIARELFNEFVPADKQKWVLAALAFLALHLYLNWWANATARRVARRLEE